LQWAWVHRGARPGSTKWLGPYGLLAHGRKTGELFFHRRRRLAGKIRSADGRWSAVEWPGSNPVGWRTGLVVAERGGSSEGLSVVEGISGGGKTLASRSRGHRRGPSGWEEVLGDAMLGVGSRWSERCWSGLSVVAQRWRARWRSGGEAGGGGRKGGCSFYSYQRGGTKAAQVAGGGGKAVGTTKQQRPWSEGCRRGWAPLFGQVPDLWAPRGFTSFQNLSKPPQTCEIKMDALFCSKNSQLLRDSILEYSKQLPQLY
jgi:hypothetical protein